MSVRLLVVLCLTVGSASAQEPVRLREVFAPGARYQVQIRVQLAGTLTPPAEKGKPELKPVAMTGESAIDYDERVLGVERDGSVNRAIRVFKRVEFERQIAGVAQKTTLRNAVKRVVQVRLSNTEVPFSPDGPLTWGEIDLLRTDVFTPALAGLLPADPVRLGQRWKASAAAVKELTDLEEITEGELECRLERVLADTNQARVSFSGTVRGTNEDGPVKQQLDGWFVFDLRGQYLSGLSLNGKHVLLNGDGKEMGKVEGRFVLSRLPTTRGDELSDAALRGLALEPNAENTRLLYENEDLNVNFLYPRRWRVSGVQGRQITLDSADGHGLLLTVEDVKKIPTAAQFLAESRAWLDKQKGRVIRATPPATIQQTPVELEAFTLEGEREGQRFTMAYYIARQGASGATLAARLAPGNLTAVQKEVEVIARSLRLR